MVRNRKGHTDGYPSRHPILESAKPVELVESIPNISIGGEIGFRVV